MNLPRKEDHMNQAPSIDYNEEFEQQLLTEKELDKVRARTFINLMSEMCLKYESEIAKKII
jgi:hypothetical protein